MDIIFHYTSLDDYNYNISVSAKIKHCESNKLNELQNLFKKVIEKELNLQLKNSGIGGKNEFTKDY